MTADSSTVHYLASAPYSRCAATSSRSFGDRMENALKPIDVEKYRQARLAKGAKPATVNREWAIVKAVLNGLSGR